MVMGPPLGEWLGLPHTALETGPSLARRTYVGSSVDGAGMIALKMRCDESGTEPTEKLPPNSSMSFDGFELRMPPGKGPSEA